MTFALNLNNTNTCVAAYALTCDTCNLNMAIIDNDKNIIADSSVCIKQNKSRKKNNFLIRFFNPLRYPEMVKRGRKFKLICHK